MEAAVYASVFTYTSKARHSCASVFVCVGVCTHVITLLLCEPVHMSTCTFACVCVGGCVGGSSLGVWCVC